MAARIAEETGGELGDRVGFQTRFEQALGGDELIKVMTDGILLVVKMGSTSKPLVDEAFAMLENLGGNVLGTCLTGTYARDPGAR